MKENQNYNIYEIIVDVDVDGTTSAATLWNFIKRIKPELQLEAIIHEKKMHGLTDDLYEDVYHNDYNLILIPFVLYFGFEKEDRTWASVLYALVALAYFYTQWNGNNYDSELTGFFV